jgi:hypothetical protein
MSDFVGAAIADDIDQCLVRAGFFFARAASDAGLAPLFCGS